jgi:polar amino acid transport system substrate-binding protein
VPTPATDSPGSWRAAALRPAAALLALTALTACAPDLAPGVPAAPLAHEVATDRELAAQVPAPVRADGLLTIGTDPSFAPMESVLPDGTIDGVDIQLSSAIARTLGLRPEFRLEAFSAIESAVRAGRFDIGIAALSVTPGQRLSTDAVLYMLAGSQLVRPVGSTATLDTLCGLRVGTPEGSVQIQALLERSGRCLAAGTPPIAITAADTQEAATQDLLDGATDAVLTDSPAAQAEVRARPALLELGGPSIDPLPYAILAPRSETTGNFAVQVLGAVNRLIEDGVYDAILQDAGIEEGGVARAVLVRANTPVPRDPFGPVTDGGG